MKTLLTILICLWSTTMYAQDVPTNYTSPYTTTIEKLYCTDAPCVGSGYCKEGYPCPNDMPYRKKQLLTGYKDINNLYNPIVLCGQQRADGSNPCELQPLTNLIGMAEGSGTSPKPPPYRIEKMRFFVPKGTTEIILRYDCYWGYALALAVRWGQPPDCLRCDDIQNNDDYYAFNFDSGYIPFNAFRERDIYLQNNGAYIPIMGLTIPPTQDPGWLYVYAFYRQIPDVIFSYSYTISVNSTDYLDWYDSTANHWDRAGNPPYRVGAQAGVVNQQVPIDQTMYLVLNTTNEYRDVPVQEWLAFWIETPGQPSQIRFYNPDVGIIPFSTDIGTPDAASYPFAAMSRGGTYPVIPLSLAGLGLVPRSILHYLYAYSVVHLDSFDDISCVVFDNRVNIAEVN